MRRNIPVSTWLIDTKGAPTRRKFMGLVGSAISATTVFALSGCTEENPCISPDASHLPDGSSADATSTYECEVDFPANFICDPSSAGGMKHTPIIQNFKIEGSDYSFDLTVPHVVKPSHHILGVQVIAFDATAENPYSLINYHYYSSAEIMTLDLEMYQTQFTIPTSVLPSGTTHLILGSVCNKHGMHGKTHSLV